MSVGPQGAAPDATGASLFQIEPSLLERAVVQAANDLRVTGFGQRTRAALRRNRSAESNSVLPYSMYKDVVGPDLVRHLNALTLLLNSGQHIQKPPSQPDRELFVALRDQLIVVQILVALMWTGLPRDHAKVFVDYDNVPIPFCPLYPDARDLLDSSLDVLPQPLTKISGRLRQALQDTPIMRDSLACSTSITSSDLQYLKQVRDNFKAQVAYQHGETLLEWRTRAFELVAAAQTETPVALILLNSLIHGIVSSVVNLAVWDQQLAYGDIISSTSWGRNALPADSLGDRHRADYSDENSMPYGTDIPDGYTLRLIPKPELILLPMETSVRLHQHERFCGIAIAKGASFSWSRDEDTEVGLTVVRLSAYEACVADRGLL